MEANYIVSFKILHIKALNYNTKNLQNQILILHAVVQKLIIIPNSCGKKNLVTKKKSGLTL